MCDDVDEALEETFPASDPPANTVETGVGVDGSSDEDEESNAEPAKPATSERDDRNPMRP